MTAEEIIRQDKYDELKNLVLICEAMDEFAKMKVEETKEEIRQMLIDEDYEMLSEMV